MTKPNLPKFFNNAKKVVTKHGPEILTGVGIAGMITTTVLAVKATPKALALIEEEKLRRYKELEDDSITKTEIFKLCWPCYVPTAVAGIASIGCIIGASSVSARRTAALAAAYQISETALTEYREKTIETVGEKKEQIIREQVNQEQINKTPLTKSEVHVTGRGETLCLDPLSKRYFRHDIERIRKAENALNKRMLHDMCGSASLNEFYSELGIEETDIGDKLGWNTEHLIDLDISPGLTDDEQPCLVIGHYHPPKWDF